MRTDSRYLDQISSRGEFHHAGMTIIHPGASGVDTRPGAISK
jgi:hypothetical protein